MASLNEIVYNIKNLASAGDSNIEFDLSNRQIQFWIHYYRAEIIKNFSMKGQSLPYEFYQRHDAQRTDLPYIDGMEGLLSDDALESPFALLVYSQTTFHEADLTEALSGDGYIEPDVDYHGRSFFEHDGLRNAGDFGHIEISLPSLVNVNNGIANLQVRKSYQIKHQNTSGVPVPIVSDDEYTNSKFNRFTKDSVKAYISYEGGQGVRLKIGRLQGMFARVADSNLSFPGGTLEAIPYQVSMKLLLNDPTAATSWNDNDDNYPIPQYLIKDLTQGALSMVQVQLSTPADNITDNADTTKIIQPQAQRQVRNSS